MTFFQNFRRKHPKEIYNALAFDDISINILYINIFLPTNFPHIL